MKKSLFMAALVACALFITGCKGNEPVDEAARVKAAAVGTWSGEITFLGGESRTVTVTFTETRVSTNEDVSANLKNWRAIDGDVWVDLDDEMSSSMKVSVNGNNMTLGGTSTYVIVNFPSSLTRVVL